jgi:subtilisin family serine protease
MGEAGAAGVGPRIGLIDGGVNALRVSGVTAQRAFASEAPVAGAHGTAVASLLAAAAPGARIYAADIYGGAPTGGTSSALARAFAWLVEERIPVVNVSLVGPRNRVIEAVISRMSARGHLIIAAVGNDGPAAAPLYPAAYTGVVGVTGVDARGRVLIEAGRGPHVDFAALGVLSAAAQDEGAARVRGTSYAAPLAAGLLALRLGEVDASEAEAAVRALREQARDLGASGRDDVYGYGLVEVAGARVASR